MKKFLFILPLFIVLAFCATESQAQSNWEVGMRFGDNTSIDMTVPIGAEPRLHPAVYLDRFGVGAYFDWMYSLSGGPTGLKFYPGIGPEVFFEGRFDLAVAGDFGAEYSFNFPLTIGVDWRPALDLTNDVDFRTGNWGFIARFRFGEGTSFVKD